MMGDRTFDFGTGIQRGDAPIARGVVWVPPEVSSPDLPEATTASGALIRTTPTGTVIGGQPAAHSALPDFLQGNITLPIVGTVSKVAALAGAAVILLLLSGGSGRR